MPTLLITGSNRGIGLEFVRQYLSEGWNVIATCRTPSKADALQSLAKEHPDKITVSPLDVADQEATEALCKKVASAGIRIDLLICNAGVLNARPFGTWEHKRFLDTVSINAIAPGMLVQAASDLLAEAAKVIFISSGIGSLSDPLYPEGPMDAYAVSKAAMNMMAIRSAEKVRDRGITLVAVSPGWVRTDMGTQEAEISVEESVSSLRKTISSLSLDDTGQFLDRFGNKLEW